MIHTVLSIAGSDPSGGAGIQADLKTFAEHGVYGMAAVTALTVQNTVGVTGVHAVPPEFVAAQIRAVCADIPPSAIKIGMVGGAGAIVAVAHALPRGVPVVLDPVMVATSGDPLLESDAEAALLEWLVPRATIVTPNLPEAARLGAGDDPEGWAKRHGVALLVKGGHAHEALVHDVLYGPEGSVHRWEHPRVASRNTHGTGCTLSSAIASRLARGLPLAAAVGGAVDYVAALIAASKGHALGAGHGPLLHGRAG